MLDPSIVVYGIKIVSLVDIGTGSLFFKQTENYQPFNAHCCHMGTAIKHPVPDRVKQSFIIFDIRAL